MNELMNNDWKDSDYDRLVDGELPPADYRRLVSSLDQRPNGWKRLACAFLEGQAWRQDFAPPAKVSLPPLRRAAAWWMRPAPQWLAMAAVLMLVFALGTQIDQARQWGGGPQREQPSDLAQDAADRRPRLFNAPGPAGLQSVGNMQVMVNRPGSDASPTSVPVFDSQDVAMDSLWNISEEAPERIIKEWKQAGLQVERQRHYVPMHLQDGRTIVLPVDRIQLAPRVTY